MSLKWLPNALTIARILAAPIILYLLSGWGEIDPASAFLWALFLFIVASVTDGLDGWAARALDASSKFGATLDLWGDKILVFAPLMGWLIAGAFSPLALIALLALTARDLVIMALRAARPDVNLGASFLAKSKTALVMVGMSIMLLAQWMLAENVSFAEPTSLIGQSLLTLGCIASLYTGLQYARAALAAPKPE